MFQNAYFTILSKDWRIYERCVHYEDMQYDSKLIYPPITDTLIENDNNARIMSIMGNKIYLQEGFKLIEFLQLMYEYPLLNCCYHRNISDTLLKHMESFKLDVDPSYLNKLEYVEIGKKITIAKSSLYSAHRIHPWIELNIVANTDLNNYSSSDFKIHTYTFGRNSRILMEYLLHKELKIAQDVVYVRDMSMPINNNFTEEQLDIMGCDSFKEYTQYFYYSDDHTITTLEFIRAMLNELDY